ncbi:hypothetical protein [Pseudaestuariivita rosea]|uniref:hypothetical protein n=1 Tax=Pseudaestuariivita rosea TaxID=2763263 RepID=UPI001ABAA631|nr:hypothetical protein [Pseudaestuariivita rosea]
MDPKISNAPSGDVALPDNPTAENGKAFLDQMQIAADLSVQNSVKSPSSATENLTSRISDIVENHKALGATEAAQIKSVRRLPDGPASAPLPADNAAFEQSMKSLKATFDHAIELELVAKVGTQLPSSMNKLMSGN